MPVEYRFAKSSGNYNISDERGTFLIENSKGFEVGFIWEMLMKRKKDFGKLKKTSIEHVDLDQLNLIVDGQKLTEARAAQMGEELAKKAHRILSLKNHRRSDK